MQDTPQTSNLQSTCTMPLIESDQAVIPTVQRPYPSHQIPPHTESENINLKQQIKDLLHSNINDRAPSGEI